MKELLLTCLFLHIHNTLCLKVIVSGYNSKVVTYDVNGTSLIPAKEWELGRAGDWMTWLQMDGDHIWAGHEVSEYEGQPFSVVSKWSVSDNGASLERLDYASTGSTGTAHILVDKDEGKVYAANYGGGSLSILDLRIHEKKGAFSQLPPKVLTYGEGCRDASHPHQTITRGKKVWVVDLGCDTIWHYYLKDDGELKSTGRTSLLPGAGPRHMVMHPKKDLMFLLCELQSAVIVYR